MMIRYCSDKKTNARLHYDKNWYKKYGNRLIYVSVKAFQVYDLYICKYLNDIGEGSPHVWIFPVCIIHCVSSMILDI